MCQRTTCRKCGKATYSGCGQHVEQVLGNVPKSERCSCDSGSDQSRPLFGGLFGRR